MKRLIYLTSLVLMIWNITPTHIFAFGVARPCAHGLPWVQAMGLNFMPRITMVGPLYNYGPYNFNSPDYRYMNLHPLLDDLYMPAYALPGSPAAIASQQGQPPYNVAPYNMPPYTQGAYYPQPQQSYNYAAPAGSD